MTVTQCHVRRSALDLTLVDGSLACHLASVLAAQRFDFPSSIIDVFE